MKIITALKEIKHNDRKIEQMQERIEKWCSYVLPKEEDEKDFALYNAEEVRVMQQQTTDWLLRKAQLKHALHFTNMNTKMTFNGTEKSVDEWLAIKTIVLPGMLETLKKFRRAEKKSTVARYLSNDDERPTEGRVIMQYDHKERDKKIEKINTDLEVLDAMLDEITLNTEVIGL